MMTTTKTGETMGCSGAGVWCPADAVKTHTVTFEGVQTDCCLECAVDAKRRGYADEVAVMAAGGFQ